MGTKCITLCLHSKLQQAFGVSPIPSAFQSGYIPAHDSSASRKGFRNAAMEISVFADQYSPETDPWVQVDFLFCTRAVEGHPPKLVLTFGTLGNG